MSYIETTKSLPVIECTSDPEIGFDTNSLAFTTSTFYRNWYPGSLQTPYDVDKIRGDLAIESINKAAFYGYKLIVVDGGSSKHFLEYLLRFGIRTFPQDEPNLSGSRRQAYKIAERMEGIKIICTTEPEKISFIEQIQLVAAPIPLKHRIATLDR